MVVEAQVVQVIAGIGVAVAFDPAPLAAAVAAARNPRAAAAPAKPDLAGKIQTALHGTKDSDTLRDSLPARGTGQ